MPDYRAYVNYVEEHVNAVKEAWVKMKSCEGFPYASDDTFKRLVDVVVENHDASKYSDEELVPYAVHFYPEEGDIEMEGEFEDAVNLHYSKNPHHWQWWITPDGVRAVTPYLRNIYLCEMVCDWMAMGVKAGNTASSYYKKVRDKIVLDPVSRTFTELLLRTVEPEEWKE